MVDPAVQGAVTILKAASKHPQISHVIVTSSIAAVRGPGLEGTSTPIVCEDTWNPSTRDDPHLNSSSVYAYYTSKAEAERAVWHYIDTTKPHYAVSVFCPPFIFGPTPLKANSASDLGSSLGIVHSLMRAPLAFPVDGS